MWEDMHNDDIIPSGNGGINGEGRTLKEICEQPVPEHLIKKLDEERLAPEVVSRMEADHLLVFVIKAFLQDTIGLKIRLEDHFLINSLEESNYGRENYNTEIQ